VFYKQQNSNFVYKPYFIKEESIMKQLLTISLYTLTLTTLLFSQSLTGNYQVDYINVDYTWVVRPPDATTDLDPILSDPGNPNNASGGYSLNVSWPSSANPIFTYPLASFAVGDTATTLPVPLWGLLQLAGFPYGWISMNVDFNDDGTFHINDSEGDFFNGPGDDPDNPIAPPPFYIHGSSYPTTVTLDCVTSQEVLPVNEDGTWTSAGTFVDEFRNQLNQGWGITLSGTFAEFHAVDLLNDVPGADYGQIGNSIDFTDFPWRDGVSAPHQTPNPSWGSMQVTYNDDFSTVQDFGVHWEATDGPSSNINVVDPTDDGYIEDEAGYYNGVLGIADGPIGTNPFDGNTIFDPTSEESGEFALLFDPVGDDGVPMSGDEALQNTGYYFTYNDFALLAYAQSAFISCTDNFDGEACVTEQVTACVTDCVTDELMTCLYTTEGFDESCLADGDPSDCVGYAECAAQMGDWQATCTAGCTADLTPYVEACTYQATVECGTSAGVFALGQFGCPEEIASAVVPVALTNALFPCLAQPNANEDVCLAGAMFYSVTAAVTASGGAWTFPDDSGHDIDMVNDLNFIDTDGDGIPDFPYSANGGRLTFQVDNLCLPVLETQVVTARFQNTENFRWLDQDGFFACAANELPACVAECMGGGGSQEDCVDYCTSVCLATNGNPGLAMINEGWNLVGLPIETSGLPYLFDADGDGVPDLDLFGDPITEGVETVPGSLYEFDGTYVPAVVPLAGIGYWMRSTTDHVAIMQGFSRLTITHSLQEGWNMIGGISDVMYLDEITDPDGIIVPGSLYEFSGTYSDAPAIAPGKGYWVRAYETGDVTFTKGSVSGKTREFQRFTDVNTLQVTDGNGLRSMPLYFGLTIADEKERLSYGLPPAPPQGAFDIRFTNDMRYIENSGVLFIQNESKELTIAYEIVDGAQWILSGETQYVLEGSGEITITGDVSRLNLNKTGYESLPDAFSLSQNFPNPFNPQTNIAIQLPEDHHTTISVWTLAGQKIATLHQGDLNAGTHTFSFNGDHLASGMYFYRVDAGPYQATKKMLLMK
jgi:hypothetical protein